MLAEKPTVMEVCLQFHSFIFGNDHKDLIAYSVIIVSRLNIFSELSSLLKIFPLGYAAFRNNWLSRLRRSDLT